MASASYLKKQKQRRVAAGRLSYTNRIPKPSISVADTTPINSIEACVGQQTDNVLAVEAAGAENGSVSMPANSEGGVPQYSGAGSPPSGFSDEIQKISQNSSDTTTQNIQNISPAALLSTPVGFAQGLLHVSLYEWQQEVLSWTLDLGCSRNKIVLAAANGSGKSERVIACAALRFISVAPQGRVVITSKDSRQIDQQVWPALLNHRGRFKDWTWLYREVKTPRGGNITAFTTDEATRMEGWHASLPDSPLLIICDEAKSISEDIFQAIDRCTYTTLLLVSSTGLRKGRFYEALTNLSGWHRRVVTCDECPHISEEDKQDIINTYGINHPFTRSRLYSEFMDQDSDFQLFCTLGDIEKCIQSPPVKQGGDIVAFVDFGGSGQDETVLAVRRGNEVKIVRAWNDASEMATVGTLVRLFRQEKLTANQIYGDAGGIGSPMISRLSEVGWNINRFHGGSPAYNERDYFNRNTEVWAEAAKKIKDGAIILPDDKILHQQICNRRMLVRSDGRAWLEPKTGAQSLASRGIKSPDRADSVLGAISVVRPELTESWISIFPGSHEDDYEDLFGHTSKLAMVAGD